MTDRVLQSYLEPIARAERRRLRARALATCWAAVGLVGLAFLFLERASGWASPWTLPALTVAAVAAAAIAIYRVGNTPLDHRSLARRIEAENPDLHALLLTAVEQHPEPGAGALHYLQQRVIAEALEHHRRRPWAEPVFKQLARARLTHGLAAIFLLLVLLGLRFRAPAIHGVLAVRSNGVTITPGDTSLERGGGLVVLARFDGKLPAEATLVLKPVNEPERHLPLTKNLDDPVYGGAVPEVRNDLAYRVEFTTGQTRDFKVTVFDYPRLERADATIVYPGYTGLPARTIQDTRRVSAVEGSALDYAFFLNKPVASARLVAKDRSALTLTGDTNHGAVYHARLTLDQSRRYELVLVDDAGRTNKVPPEFVLEALKNRPPELKLALPRGDQRVSPLEEIAFEADADDDFGLRAYGVAYALAGHETRVVQLGQDSRANEKRHFNYLLPLEALGAQPDQLLTYYVWADDLGPDGRVRRTTSDMYFAEIRPFDEIFREGQSSGGGEMGGAGGGEGRSPTQKLAELQKQIVSATWNLQRRETGSRPSPPFKQDAAVVHESQEQALEQARSMQEQTEDPRLKGLVDAAENEMKKAAGQLKAAAAKNSVQPLPQALAAEQSAYQALLRLQAREFQVARNRNQRGGGGGQSAQQRQIDQLDLKQADNRYETQRQAAPAQNRAQREQLQVLNRLKELAQRQQDLNARLKELQTALQEARTDAEREDIRRRLKRLREEQRDLLADVDELRQRMERPENQSRLADARQQLDQTRSEIERAAEALDQPSVPHALAAGTRAERQLQQLQDDVRKQTSSQFAEAMRQMRNDARQLAQKQDALAQKLDDLAAPKRKTLGDSEERQTLARGLAQQKNGLTNLFTQMRQVSEQSETAEPLLAKQLYDLLRQTGQGDLDKSLDLSAELVRRGFLPQAGQFEQHARQNIDDLKRGVERATESVLGDETEALRLAKRELEELDQQLEKELAQAGAAGNRPTNAAAGERPSAAAQSSGPSPDQGPRQPGTDSRNDGQNQSGQSSAPQAGAQANQGQPNPSPGGGGGGGSRGQPQSGASANPAESGNPDGPGGSAGAGGRRSGAGSRRAAGGNGFNRNAGADGGDGRGGGGGGEYFGPLTGPGFVDWSDRLRDVEELLDVPDLRTDVARIRDRARAVRLDYKRSGKKPDWAVVRSRIAAPLAEVRSRVGEELARRGSKDALVPIDRDPVPAKFSELVRRYYEQLGKSE